MLRGRRNRSAERIVAARDGDAVRSALWLLLVLALELLGSLFLFFFFIIIRRLSLLTGGLGGLRPQSGI